MDPVTAEIIPLVATSVALSLYDTLLCFVPYMIDKVYFSRCICMTGDRTMFFAVAIYIQSYIKKIIEDNIRVRLSTMSIDIEQIIGDKLVGQAYVPRADTYIKFSESIRQVDGSEHTYDVWIRSLPKVKDSLVGITGFQIYTSADYIEVLMCRIRIFSRLYTGATHFPLYIRPEFYRGPLTDGSRAYHTNNHIDHDDENILFSYMHRNTVIGTTNTTTPSYQFKDEEKQTSILDTPIPGDISILSG